MFKVKISREVIDDIIAFAKENYPREFFAYLEGKRKGEIIVVKNLAYHPFDSDENTATTIFHMGTHRQDFVGTVHSHPSGQNMPSRQDLRSFNKDGAVHFIIGKPFDASSIKCYSLDGKEIEYEVA